MDNIIEIPKSAVKLSRGYAIDYGRSSIRLVYRDKIDANNNDKPRNMRGTLRTAKFQADEIDKLGKFIKKNCEVDFANKTVYITGNRCSILKRIEPDVDFRLEVLPEVECIISALRYFHHRRQEDIFYPITESTTKMIKQKMAMIMSFVNAVAGHSEIDQPTHSEKDPTTMETASEKHTAPEVDKEIKNEFSTSGKPQMDSALFPGIVCIFEENLSFYYVDENGHTTLLETVDGLESLRALASLITGTTLKDFKTLFELINLGESSRVDTMSGELIVSKPGDIYGELPLDWPVYLLGKCLDRNSKFQAADAIRSLFRTMCDNVAQMCQVLAQIYKSRSAYVTGFAIDFEMAFDEVTAEVTGRALFSKFVPYTIDVKLNCCRHGEFLAALGAYIHSTLRQDNH